MKALKKMPDNKSPGNDGITKDFYESFWENLKTLLLLSVKNDFKVGGLNNSEKQAVITLTEKKTEKNDLLKI